MKQLEQGGPSSSPVRTKLVAVYGQDSWQLRRNLTLSLGLRWEPYLAQRFEENMMNFFDMDAFLRGEKTSQFVNAPPGLFYPGDPQFPEGGSSTNPITNKWDKFAPRLGLVWDPFEDGRTVVRAAYGIFYEGQNAEWTISVGQGAPWASKALLVEPGGGFDDPFRDFPGGNPFPTTFGPNVVFPQGGVFATAFPDTQPPYVQQWNFGIQREIVPNWLVSASYIGNQMTHVAGAMEINPGMFIPGVSDANGNCFATVLGRDVSLNVGGAGRTCSTSGNLQQRRVLSLLDPVGGTTYGAVGVWDDGGTRSYNGLVLSLQKRMSSNFSTTVNYTWSHCIATPSNFLLNGRPSAGVFNDNNDRGFDRGNCTTNGQDIRHIANATAVVQVPQFTRPWVQGLLGDWRLSGILRARSGNPLSVTVSPDVARTGRNTRAQRANQTSSSYEGNQCTTDLRSRNPTCRWLNADAFATPAPGTLGNSGSGAFFGPGAWTIDFGLSRTFAIGEAQRFEVRAEATNVLNHANFGNPSTRLGSRFGRITSAADPRIIQFGLKYLF